MRVSLLFVLALSACDKDPADLRRGDTGDTAPTSELPMCPGSWSEHDDGVWLQPVACLAWSPRAADTMDWYAAVSPDEAVAGGCGTHCDDEPGYCAELGELGDIATWRLPSRSELQDAGFAEPLFDGLEDPLWSRDSSTAMESMAHQVKLSTPELEFQVGKDQDGWVRCVADL